MRTAVNLIVGPGPGAARRKSVPAAAGYAWLLYKSGSSYVQLLYKDAGGVYKPLMYKVA